MATKKNAAVQAEKVRAETATVSAPNGLNLRGEPAGDGRILTVLRDGETVGHASPPKGRAPEGWSYVETSSGPGWVMTQFLRAPGEG